MLCRGVLATWHTCDFEWSHSVYQAQPCSERLHPSSSSTQVQCAYDARARCLTQLMNLAQVLRHPIPSPNDRSVAAAAAGQPSQVITPSRKLVRSRKLAPECPDPEDTTAHEHFWHPLTQLLPATEFIASASSQHLPAAYHAPEYQNLSLDEHDWGVRRPFSPLDVLRAKGGYLASDTQPLQLLAAAVSLDSARQTLGPKHQDDFLNAPDYRYQVDGNGRILDMVYIKSHRIPRPFQHAITSSMPARAPAEAPTWSAQAQAPELAQGIAADTFVAQQGDDRLAWRAGTEQQQQDEAQDVEQQADGRYDFLGPAQPELSSPAAADAGSDLRQQATLDSAGGAATGLPQSPAGPTLWGPRQRTATAQTLSFNDDSYLDVFEPATSARRRGSGSAQPRRSAAAQTSVPLRELLPQDVLASMVTAAETIAINPEGDQGDQVTRSPGDESQQAATVGASQAQPPGTQPTNGPVLRAFPYCVGPKQLFNSLWELDLLDQITFTDQLDQADLVLHKLGAPGERQFAYDRLLAAAKQRGIPFVTIRDVTAAELGTSLLPVYELYRGRLSPEQITKQYGAKARSKLGRRIRL